MSRRAKAKALPPLPESKDSIRSRRELEIMGPLVGQACVWGSETVVLTGIFSHAYTLYSNFFTTLNTRGVRDIVAPSTIKAQNPDDPRFALLSDGWYREPHYQ